MDNGGRKGKGHQGTCMNDTWTKSEWGRIKGEIEGHGGGEMETTVLEE